MTASQTLPVIAEVKFPFNDCDWDSIATLIYAGLGWEVVDGREDKEDRHFYILVCKKEAAEADVQSFENFVKRIGGTIVTIVPDEESRKGIVQAIERASK